MTQTYKFKKGETVLYTNCEKPFKTKVVSVDNQDKGIVGINPYMGFCTYTPVPVEYLKPIQ